MSEDTRHSALYLTDSRDSWWNEDYLQLLACRLELDKARDILDVGCGKGHFTRIIARLAPNAKVIGIDREQAWIDDARNRSQEVAYQVGSVEALPFPDASFDVVTCQTLLIHVPDVHAAVKEMARVLRPGGRVVAAEPNNLAENFAKLVGDPRFDLDDVLAFVRLQAICEKGKSELGLGYNSIGETVCTWFAAAGLKDIRAWLNDKCTVLLPPHREDVRALLDEERAHFDNGALVWPEDETRRYFVAGGGEPTVFNGLWERARRAWATRLSMSHSANEGGLFYVVTGQR